jgi:TIGR03009 family protein
MRILATRPSVSSFVLCLAVGSSAAAQQQVTPVQPTGQQPLAPGVQPLPQAQPPAQAIAPVQAVVQAPPGFELNALQQAKLDLVLNAWQTESGKINDFKCPFERWEYNAFSPKVNGEEAPLNKCSGELSYMKPDKGSFQITEIRTFKTEPPAAGAAPGAPAKSDWVKQPNAIGEHWVCDGKSVFEYRHQDKHLVERPIPPQLQGQSIVDGPLPFLFGAEAAKLKARYWLRVEEQENKNIIWLTAKPRFQAQAADYKQVEVMLDQKALLPKAMRVEMPDGSKHVYIFDVAKATINNPLAKLAALFQRPGVPRGWKHVVEQPPVAQAANPDQPPR